MGTEIKIWQIINGKLTPIDTDLKDEGRTEPYDLEPWIASNQKIIGTDILIIGRQVPTKSGNIDLLGIDKSGNTVVIELKRDELPRDSLAQAIDYASSVAEWDRDKLSEVYSKHVEKMNQQVLESGADLQEALIEAFPDVNLENLQINSTQRIILIGFSIEASLERMIEWLSDSYGVSINAIVLGYVKTKSGDELLMKTSIISEEMEKEKEKKKKFEIPMSDDPPAVDYDLPQLKQLLIDYLSRDRITNRRMRDILFPALLRIKESEKLSRTQLVDSFIKFDPKYDESKIGFYLTSISSQLGMKKNDFLRQVVTYEYPRYQWEKDNFSLQPAYRNLVHEVLEELKEK